MILKEEQKVLDKIDEGKEEIIQFLQKLLNFKTISPDTGKKATGDEFIKHQAFVNEFLQGMGCNVDVWDIDASKMESFRGSGLLSDRDMSNMPVLNATLKGSGGGKSIILNGHYDVVPVGLIENWSHDPFAGDIVGGKIIGRGTNDMKGGITAMMMAIKCIQQAGASLKGDVLVQTVPDEEATCMGALSACQKGYKADAAIIPEPTDMKVLVAVRGNAYGKITVLGRAGHSEMPQPHFSEGGAVNAIYKAMKVLGGIEELVEEWRTRPDKQHKYLHPDMLVPTVIHGGEWPVTYPEKVEISFDGMFIPATDADQYIKELEDKIHAVAMADPWLRENPPKLEIEGWMYGAEVEEDEPIVQLGLNTLSDLGYEPRMRGYGTLTDCVHLINYSKIPTISIGPDIKTAHMADEFVTIDQLIDTTKAIALSVLRWCN